MSTHKFRVGQMVDFYPLQRIGVAASQQEYKVLRLMPAQSGEQMYRIKTVAEAFERSARESELVIRA